MTSRGLACHFYQLINKDKKKSNQVSYLVSTHLIFPDLLRKANEAIEEDQKFKFVYADMHGNLKFVLNKPLNIKCVNHFRNEEDIVNIISVYCEEDEF